MKGNNRDIEAMERALRAPNIQPMAMPQRQPDFVNTIQQAATAQPSQADFVSLLQNMGQGGAVDYGALMNQFQPKQEEKPSTLKNILNVLGETAAAFGQHMSANPGAGTRASLVSGFTSTMQNRSAKEAELKKKTEEDQKALYKDMMNTAKDQRQYGIDVGKADMDGRRLERDMISKDIMDQKNIALTNKANRGPAGGNWEDKLLAQDTLNQRNKKEEREYTETKETKKKLGEMQEGADIAADQLDAITTLKSLMPEFVQGPLALGGATHVAGRFFGAKGSEAAKTFDKMVVDKFTIARAKLLGSNPSDRDSKLLEEVRPDSTNNPSVNMNIMNGYEAVSQRKVQETEAAAQWVKNKEVTGGDLNDFKSAWRKYQNAYPLLQKKKNGTLDINKANLDNWQMIFDPNFNEIVKQNKGKSKASPKQGVTDQSQAKQHEPTQIQQGIDQQLGQGKSPELIKQFLLKKNIPENVVNSMNYGQ